VRSTGDLERTILALVGAGSSARDFAGRDLVAALRARRGGSGSFQGQVNLTAFGILALRATGAGGSELARSASWLRRAQNRDGGWGFQPDEPSDPDSTGAALQALDAAGGGGESAADGVRYLNHVQERDGGWSLAESGPSNSQSTAWAVQGLIAAGANPAAVRKDGRSPFGFLAARRAGDGRYEYSKASDQTPVWVTSQVLLAVSRETFPLDPVRRAPGAAGGGEGASGKRSGGKRPAESARAGKRDAERGDSAVEAERRSSAGPDAAAAPAFEQTSADDGGPSTSQIVLGGLGLLAVVLAAGFLVYRRRLPT